MADNNDNKQLPATPTNDRSLLKDLRDYALQEYVIPKSKDILHDVFTGVTDMFGDAIRGAIDKQFYGEDRSRHRKSKNNSRNYSNQNVPYNTYSYSNRERRPNFSQRPGYEVEDVWAVGPDAKDKAIEWKEALCESIEQYGNAKVGSLYEMARLPSTPDDWKYGWTDMHMIDFIKDGRDENGYDKYLMQLPKPVKVI